MNTLSFIHHKKPKKLKEKKLLASVTAAKKTDLKLSLYYRDHEIALTIKNQDTTIPPLFKNAFLPIKTILK